jgi:hypothetical protein
VEGSLLPHGLEADAGDWLAFEATLVTFAGPEGVTMLPLGLVPDAGSDLF